MADMEIKVNRNPIQVNNINTAPVQTREVEKATPKKTENEALQNKPLEDIEERLEDVVSVSKDGDTVQVTEESNERLEEDAFGKVAVRNENEPSDDRTGTVREETENIETVREVENTREEDDARNEAVDRNPTRERLEEAADQTKPDAAKERLEAQKESDARRKEIIKDMIKSDDNDKRADEINDEKKEEQARQNITTYTGYTDEQLQRMVREGQISQNDYNKEMDARKDRTEAAIENNNEFARDMAVNIAEEELNTRQGEELRTVFSEDSNDVPDAETRAEVLDKLQDFTLGA
ncbi:MAG: hypothetical protein IJS86_05380 [Lachnospiraceae bacterium]|nr:hypothetical protein [Lachnospiraceae bacterium]